MTEKTPLVSIIINCFNGEKYLKESLESILKQSYKNWEIIFWDYQSTDSSEKIFKSYNDKRFFYFYATKHTSLYKARNLAIEKSKGDFISFLDVDDFWDKDKLQRQMPYFNSSKVGVVFSNLWVMKKNKNTKKIYTNSKLPRGRIFNELINNYNIGILTTVIRKVFFLQLEKKFDERFSIIGDFDLFLRLSKLCEFESIQEPLAFYRLHGQNLSTLNKEKEVKEYEIWINENQLTLNQFQMKKIKTNVNYRKFVNFKIDGNYKECISMILSFKINFLNIKNLIILFSPVVLLKKILWYHQNYNDLK